MKKKKRTKALDVLSEQAEVVMGTSPGATDTRQKCATCGVIYTDPALATCPYPKGPGMDAVARKYVRCVFSGAS